jgi:hypothetical protein
MSIFVRNLGVCLVASSYSEPDSLHHSQCLSGHRASLFVETHGRPSAGRARVVRRSPDKS